VRRLFGTDGIRGEAGQPPLVEETLYRLGRAMVAVFRRAGSESPTICLGRDTRESGEWIERVLARGVRDAGGAAISAGILPTPALALATREQSFVSGLMISASHNPFADNGVKVFDAEGRKLPDEVEERIERQVEREPGPPGPSGGADNRLDAREELQETYLGFLERARGGADLAGLTVALDAAHGAAFRLGPEAFRRAGARTIVLGDSPDGRNINDGCGSMHPEPLAAAVREHGADIGFAFDGDADRCIGVSARGRVLDGDFLLWYAARQLAQRGQLPGGVVVATVMSNLGLERALERDGLRLERTAVGDRYVLAALRQGGYALGGEQSGHVIFMDHAPTGDGVLTALLTATWLRAGAGAPDELLDQLPRFPQRLENIRVRDKPAIEEHPALREAVRRAREELGRDGRVVVRYSGTEPKARVMIEGPDAATVDRLVEAIVRVFREQLT
jgi:phosphoglucosamine mutase